MFLKGFQRRKDSGVYCAFRDEGAVRSAVSYFEEVGKVDQQNYKTTPGYVV